MHMNIDSYFLNGALEELQQYGVDAETAVQMKHANEALEDHPEGHKIWRKVASMVADTLYGAGFSKNAIIFEKMATSKQWDQAYTRILTNTIKPIFTSPLVKEAGVGKFVSDIPKGLFTLLAGAGLVGGGVAHYAGKRIDEDDVKIEKQRAIYNEYLRLADELDRIAARNIKREAFGQHV